MGFMVYLAHLHDQDGVLWADPVVLTGHGVADFSSGWKLKGDAIAEGGYTHAGRIEYSI